MYPILVASLSETATLRTTTSSPALDRGVPSQHRTVFVPSLHGGLRPHQAALVLSLVIESVGQASYIRWGSGYGLFPEDNFAYFVRSSAVALGSWEIYVSRIRPLPHLQHLRFRFETREFRAAPSELRLRRYRAEAADLRDHAGNLRWQEHVNRAFSHALDNY